MLKEVNFNLQQWLHELPLGNGKERTKGMEEGRKKGRKEGGRERHRRREEDSRNRRKVAYILM